ncbi:hypothetical protein [Mycobacteroides abscessus]|uniref:hypothetical protein n=1 Tax=Mycobacteroides abscessus TaxID=36809 RepID=UPI0002585130|nr:hypothetical protein [Mycobacteroides abscessus]EIC67162.1 gp25 [Mycobacteroides abscessus M93]
MVSNTVPKAPKGLGTRARTLWREIHAQFDFTADPHRKSLIEEACRTVDTIDRLQAEIDAASDLRVRGSQGQPVAIPELPELRQYRSLLASLLKSLSLPDTEELSTLKKDNLSSVRRRAANIRYH